MRSGSGIFICRLLECSRLFMSAKHHCCFALSRVGSDSRIRYWQNTYGSTLDRQGIPISMCWLLASEARWQERGGARQQKFKARSLKGFSDEATNETCPMILLEPPLQDIQEHRHGSSKCHILCVVMLHIAFQRPLACRSGQLHL